MPEGTSSTWRLVVVGITAFLTLVMVNVQIAGREQVLRSGVTVLLPLAPVDPRSLLQGDYMALRYAMTDAVAGAAARAGITDGTALIRLDDRSRASFVRLYQGGDLGSGEHLLRFRRRGDSVRLASDAFFFEEGSGDRYANARFGELKAGADGQAVLVGLRDADGERLGNVIEPVGRGTGAGPGD